MRILVLKPFVVAKTNGGEISLLARLRELKNRGYEIRIECAVPEAQRGFLIDFLRQMQTPLGEDSSYEVDGLRVRVSFSPQFHPHELSMQGPMEDYFQKRISEVGPDLTLTHFTDFFATSAALKWNADRALISVTDNEFPRLSTLRSFPSLHPVYTKIRQILVASTFMSREVKREFPAARVWKIPNPVEPVRSISGTAQFLLFVNPVPVKGLDFVLKLAEELPDEKFMFVGNWNTSSPPQLPQNVEWRERQSDLSIVFSESKLLLHPSHWEEAFGRLVLEAMSAGLPVLASDRGGLPETVGTGGIVLPLDLARWKMEIRTMRRDLWESRGRERFEAYQHSTRRRFDALHRLLRRLFP